MLPARVAAFIDRHRLLDPATRVVVGLSGGVDSVVLVYVLHRLGYRPLAVHVNYGLRGEASERDEAFARGFCAHLDLPLHVERPDLKACMAETGRSLQEAARALRYDAFMRHAAAQGVDRAAVAHHLDDQVETVLLQLFRGTGPEGLAGMPVRRALAPGHAAELVRPLLGLRRRDIEAYARAEGLSWRQDESNASPAYRRNRLRTVVLPLLEAHFGPAVVPNIDRSARLVREALKDPVREQLAAHFGACGRAAAGGGGSLLLEGLRTVGDYWRRRLILEALARWLPGVGRSYATAERIAGLLEAQPGKVLRWKQGAVWRARDRLRFVPASDAGARVPGAGRGVHLVEAGQCVPLPEGTLCIDIVSEAPPDLAAEAPGTVYLDAEHLQFPLAVRRWQPADRMQPLGLRGSKKVSDVLTDAKVPVHRRKDVLVVLSAGTIVWVAGLRLGAPARVRPETRRIAKMSFRPAENH